MKLITYIYWKHNYTESIVINKNDNMANVSKVVQLLLIVHFVVVSFQVCILYPMDILLQWFQIVNNIIYAIKTNNLIKLHIF